MIMVVIALANRYVLVPRMRQDEDRAAPWFVWMTKLEWAIGAVVLVIISLLATLEPFGPWRLPGSRCDLSISPR